MATAGAALLAALLVWWRGAFTVLEWNCSGLKPPIREAIGSKGCDLRLFARGMLAMIRVQIRDAHPNNGSMLPELSVSESLSESGSQSSPSDESASGSGLLLICADADLLEALDGVGDEAAECDWTALMGGEGVG